MKPTPKAFARRLAQYRNAFSVFAIASVVAYRSYFLKIAGCKHLFLARPMRLLAIFAVGLTLSACVSREAVYQRSLTAPHPHVPQSDFEHIAEILSRHTHQSITSVEALPDDMVMVHVAFPGEQGPGSGDDLALMKRDGRWHMLNATNTVIE